MHNLHADAPILSAQRAEPSADDLGLGSAQQVPPPPPPPAVAPPNSSSTQQGPAQHGAPPSPRTLEASA